MSDHDAFLAAILDRPDDDLPRLVYADYLDDHGDAERAELIRLQCHLAGLPEGAPDRDQLLNRERELLRAHARDWKVPGVKAFQVFRRGFVEAVGIRVDHLLTSASRLFAAAPIREVRVYQTDERFDDLLRLPELALVESLDLTNGNLTYFNRLERLVNEAPLDRLRKLSLRYNSLWADSLPVIARSTVGRRLETLDLSGNRIGDAGAEVLAAESGFAGLVDLVVRNDEIQYEDSIHAAGAAALAQSRSITGLRRLDLRGHYLGDAGVAGLLRSPIANGLEWLDVSDNELGVLGEGAFEAVAASPHLGRLQYLNLRSSRVTRLAAKALVNWSGLQRGAVIELRDCEFEPLAIETLLRSEVAGRLVLDVPAEPVG